jgi:phenylpyruvate tautomerase PptA (4-oxalocrotonate tautomerase family)
LSILHLGAEMTLIQVPVVRTTPTQKEFIKAVTKVLFERNNKVPKKETVGVIFSQFGLETGLGKNCYNYNLGNIKARDIPGMDIKFMALTGVWEIINGIRVELKAQDPGSWFRAFDTLEDGIKYHMKFLNNSRYNSCWESLEAGDPAKFASVLRKCGYYTAPESDYVKGMQRYFNSYMKSTDFEDGLKELGYTENVTVLPEVEIVGSPDFVKSDSQQNMASLVIVNPVKTSWVDTLLSILGKINFSKISEVLMSLLKK